MAKVPHGLKLVSAYLNDEAEFEHLYHIFDRIFSQPLNEISILRVGNEFNWSDKNLESLSKIFKIPPLSEVTITVSN